MFVMAGEINAGIYEITGTVQNIDRPLSVILQVDQSAQLTVRNKRSQLTFNNNLVKNVGMLSVDKKPLAKVNLKIKKGSNYGVMGKRFRENYSYRKRDCSDHRLEKFLLMVARLTYQNRLV